MGFVFLPVLDSWRRLSAGSGLDRKSPVQGKFMKESYPRKWVLEPGHPQADGFCIFAGARFLAAVKCRIRFRSEVAGTGQVHEGELPEEMGAGTGASASRWVLYFCRCSILGGG